MRYLSLKTMNLPIPDSKNLFSHLVDADGNASNDIFNEIDALIEGKIPENQLFLFLPRHDKSQSKNGLGYYCRKGGNGFWRVHSSKPFIHRTSVRPLKDCGGTFMELFAEGKGAWHKIGKKTRFVCYEGKEKPGIQTEWLMDEFELNHNYLPKKVTKCVLSKVFRKEISIEPSEDEDEDDEMTDYSDDYYE